MSSHRPVSPPDLAFDTGTSTSPALTSTSDPHNICDPEYYDAPPDLNPAILAASDEQHPELELPTLDEVVNSSQKEVMAPKIHMEIPDFYPMVTSDSPLSALPNPYDPAPREAVSRPDEVHNPILTVGESESDRLRRLPSVLRPSHPRFARSIDSTRASASLGGLEFGLPPAVSEDGSFLDLESWRGRRSFTAGSQMAYSPDAAGGDVTINPPLLVQERITRYSTIAAEAPKTRHTFYESSLASFSSEPSGINSQKEFTSWLEQASEIRTGHTHHSSLSGPFPYGHSSGFQSHMEPLLQQQQPSDVPTTDLSPDKRTDDVRGKSSRWKFWSRKKTPTQQPATLTKRKV